MMKTVNQDQWYFQISLPVLIDIIIATVIETWFKCLHRETMTNRQA